MGLVLRLLTVSTLVALLCSCGGDPVPLQQVDWRNGPYAEPCALEGEGNAYVDGRTVNEDGKEPSTALGSVGYAELDGREGEEAVLEHVCGPGTVSLSIWTGSDDGPRRLGPVPEPERYLDSPRWSVDDGVLCVRFTLGEEPDAGVEDRPVAVTDSGVTLLEDQFCAVDDR